MTEIGPDADLSFQSFIGHDLRGVDLSGANLRRAILDGADLEGANLSGADLQNASMVGTNAMKAAFDNADMRNVKAKKARFGLANFQNARMDGADLRGIRGRYAVWRGANWWDEKYECERVNSPAKSAQSIVSMCSFSARSLHARSTLVTMSLRIGATHCDPRVLIM